MPALPDVPNMLKIEHLMSVGNDGSAMVRWFVEYSGSAPSDSVCNSVASALAAAWATNLAPLANTDVILNEITVTDLTSPTSGRGVWSGSHAGTRSTTTLPGATTTLPGATAVLVNMPIARRYRGGKPRIFFPPPVDTDLFSPAEYNAAFVTAATTGVEAFFSGIEALTPGTMTSLTHVNLSYYKGFTNYTPPSGRARAVPTYRPEALHDDITGYSVKEIIGSQRRRRTSTTP